MKAGIVHIGVGGFHRSHEAHYTDELMGTGDLAEWGICGVGLMEADRKMCGVLKKQDCLYTLIVKHPSGKVENSCTNIVKVGESRGWSREVLTGNEVDFNLSSRAVTQEVTTRK
jgi:mannitol-1-phosphate/altronate dehydrogenase